MFSTLFRDVKLFGQKIRLKEAIVKPFRDSTVQTEVRQAISPSTAIAEYMTQQKNDRPPNKVHTIVKRNIRK